ncbi:MAG: hypothetical protein ABII09_02255 [Planctomycetota bacterium]
MRNPSVILCLLMVVGCNTPSSPPPVSHYDAAIENLSITADQLESVQKEKDFFVKSLEEFELQKTEYGRFLDTRQLHSQMQDFTEWHHDISQRERNLEVQHVLNVLAAHTQVVRRRTAEPNLTETVIAAPVKP